MTYSCSDFTDSVLEALNIEVPEESSDSPSDQADLALEAIRKLRHAATFVEMVAEISPCPTGPDNALTVCLITQLNTLIAEAKELLA